MYIYIYFSSKEMKSQTIISECYYMKSNLFGEYKQTLSVA